MPSLKKPKLKPDSPPRSAVGGVLPEVVDHLNRVWKVVEGEPGIDYRQLVVSVPSGEDRRAERLRVLAKVRISPETPEWAKKIASPQNIDAMEDLRARKAVDENFNFVASEQHMPDEIREQIRNAVRKGDQQEAARLGTRFKGGRALGNQEYEALWEAERRQDPEGEKWQDLLAEAEEFKRYIGAADRLVESVDYRTSVAAAKMLDELDTLRKPGKRGRGQAGSGDQEAESFEDLVEQTNTPGGETTGKPIRDARELAEKAKRDFNEALRDTGGFGSGGDGEPTVGEGTPFELDSDDFEIHDEDASWDACAWGKPEWVKPPLLRNMTLRKASRRKRPTDEGAVVRNMHRWYTDRRVFDRKKKVPGGTLMVDISGSMSLSAEQVDAIVEVSPMATIVTYSGSSGRGTMRLIAKAGRRADDDSIYVTMGGNEIDGPALKWLAEQAEPRVWVSDGLACTANGDTAACMAWCRRFAKKNRIVRMASADEALRLLRRLW